MTVDEFPLLNPKPDDLSVVSEYLLNFMSDKRSIDASIRSELADLGRKLSCYIAAIKMQQYAPEWPRLLQIAISELAERPRLLHIDEPNPVAQEDLAQALFNGLPEECKQFYVYDDMLAFVEVLALHAVVDIDNENYALLADDADAKIQKLW